MANREADFIAITDRMIGWRGRRLFTCFLGATAMLCSPLGAQTVADGASNEEENPDGLWHAYGHYAPEYDECDAQLVGKFFYENEPDNKGMELIISLVQNGAADGIPELLELSRAKGNVCVFDSEDTTSISGAQRESDERPGVMLDFLYHQRVGAEYSVGWYGRIEEKADGFRTVYYESDRLVSSFGHLSFWCESGDGGLQLEDELVSRTWHIQREQFDAWSGKYTEGDDFPNLPYEVFVVAKYNYCYAQNK